jgi:hypothetical protein
MLPETIVNRFPRREPEPASGLAGRVPRPRLVELPTEVDHLDELLYVGLTRATTELVVIAPPELGRRLA